MREQERRGRGNGKCRQKKVKGNGESVRKQERTGKAQKKWKAQAEGNKKNERR